MMFILHAVEKFPLLRDISLRTNEQYDLDIREWLTQCELMAKHHALLGNRLPAEISRQFAALKARLAR